MASSPSRMRYSPDGSRRQGHLLSLMGASNRLSDRTEGIDPYMYLNIAVFLAFKHVQQRNGTVLASLPERLTDCDFDWTFSTRDTQFSPRKGVEELVAATEPPRTRKAWLNSNETAISSSSEPELIDEDWQFPFAIVGEVYSRVSIPLALLGHGHALPQVSGSATSATLDNAPFFSRTIATTEAEATAAMVYYKSIGVTHVGCLYVKDPWGISYATSLQNAAYRLGISTAAFPYDDGNESSIQHAMRNLKTSGMRHIFAIMFDWQPIIDVAIKLELIGNSDHSWISASMIEWTSGVREFNRSNPRELQIADALRGVGSLTLDGGNNTAFDEAMNEFANSVEMQQEYIQSYPPADRFIYENYTFLENVQDYFFQRSFYDATYGLALAGCQTPGLFTGEELFKTLVNLDFEGVTGKIQFDNITGTRKPETVAVQIDNVFWSEENSDHDFVRLDSRRAVRVSAGQVELFHPWRYYDNTTNVPLPIPAMEHDYNLMPIEVQFWGWFLGGSVIVLSLGIIGWTWYNRNIYVSLHGSAVVGLLRFVVAFSALFSKTWRLNKLMESGMCMRRIHVKSKDVIRPFVILMSLTVVLLFGWSIVSPLEYVRVQGRDVDRYGRSLESHGQCRSPDTTYLGFLIPILFFNFVGLVKGTHQSYVARNLPTALSESTYLALSMASLLETLLLGGPIFFMVMNNPTATYLVGSCLLWVLNMAVLLPVFVPKYLHRKDVATRQSMESIIAASRSQLVPPESQDLSRRNSVGIVSKPGFMYITRKGKSMESVDATNSRHFSSHLSRGNRAF